MLSAPGLYRLVLPDFEGFQPVPSPELRVRDGRYTEHVIALVRSDR